MTQLNPSSAEGATPARLSLIPFNPKSDASASVIIDAVANEDATPAKGAASAPAGAATLPKPSWASMRTGAVAAAFVLGVGGGIAGGVGLSGRLSATQDLARANHELHVRVGALEAQVREEANRPRVAQAAIGALRAELEKARAASAAQSAQLTARFDRADHEVGARLEKVEKVLASKDATASIRPPVSAQLGLPAPAAIPALASPTPPKDVAQPARGNDHARLPVGGWVLRDVHDGVAYVEGVAGLREVGPGDYLPGAGRVQRLERRAGQWVLITSAGVIDREAY